MDIAGQQPTTPHPKLTRWGIPVGLFLLALIARLPALGRFLTPDEFLWVDRSRNFLAGVLNTAYVCPSPVNHTGFEQAVGLACTLRTGHPGVTTMWSGSVGILLRYLADGLPGPLFDYVISFQTNPLDAHFIAPARLPTVILTSLWVAAVYWLVWRLFDRRWVALTAGLLLALDPFHIALSRVIHHDALATTFMTLSLLTAMIYWGRRRSRRWLIASGLLGGLAFLSKSPALMMNPIIALLGVWALLDRRRQGEKLTARAVAATVGDGLLWFGCAVLAFVAFWPAMWVIPAAALRTVFVIGAKYASEGHAKGNFFLGAVSNDPGVIFYPFTWLLRSSPLVWLGLLAAGLSLPFRGRRPGESPPASTGVYLLLLLLYAALFTAFMTLGEKKQDRYLLPIYPAMTVIAAAGLVQLANLKPAALNRYAKGALVGLALLFQAGLVAANYPYYFTYYNPLLGGLPAASRWVTIGWGEGLDQAAAYLNQKPGAEKLRVSSWYQSTFAPFFKGEAISYSQEKGKALAGDYVVFYLNQWQRRFPDEELYRYFEDRYRPEKVIALNGVDYVAIYPGPHIQHYVEDRVDENRRVYRGIAALLGWDWPTAADPDRPQVAAGGALPFRLYWEYLGKAPEERFFFRLLGPDGQVWAEGASQPLLSENGDPAAWRQGQIVTEAGDLTVPPGTPPGEYRLQIGFYTQAPAVTAGELTFDLPPEEARVQVTPADTPPDPADLPLSTRVETPLAGLRLLGGALPGGPLTAGEPWTAELYWQAAAAPPADYRARLSLVDAAGQARWSWEAAPPVEFYPTSRWADGEVVRSRLAVTPTTRTPGGAFELALTLLDGAGRAVGRATLGPVRVEGRPRSFTAPAVETPVGAAFGEEIELVGFNLSTNAPLSGLKPGDELSLDLIWRALAPIEADYTVTVQLLGPDGHIYGQHDALPLAGAAPTSSWTPGEVLADAYRLTIDAGAPPGEYRLLAGIYLLETGQRLPLPGGRETVTLARVALN